MQDGNGGKRTKRFNEDDTQSVQTVTMRDYMSSRTALMPKNQKDPAEEGQASGKKIKVNLRSVNNPAEREKFRQMLKDRTAKQQLVTAAQNLKMKKS